MPPRSYVSASVWPSGDWLPFRYVERATKFNGWFGLARHQFPACRMSKHQFFGVQELALQAERAAAGAAPVAGVPADRMADRRQVRADLVRAPRLEAHAQQRAARQALDHLEMGDR